MEFFVKTKNKARLPKKVYTEYTLIDLGMRRAIIDISDSEALELQRDPNLYVELWDTVKKNPNLSV